ncbi:MAG: site-specific integrase [Alphaproteobacteria bacterium]|nr:site-specific integrase [Alphaproteobacteria bacterium]
MPTLKIGRRTVANLPAVEHTTLFYDSDLKGFGIRVMPSGVRSYIISYRVAPGGRKAPTRRMSLGRVELVTPEKAREKARDLLARARLGEDPAADRAEARKAATVTELLPRYNAETGAGRRESTRKLYEMYWRVHILPAIGSKRARHVTYSDVAGLHQKIGQKSPPTANRVLVALACFFDWARRIGERPAGENPARDIEKFQEEPRERFLTSEELGRLGAAIHEAETIGLPWEPDPNKKVKHCQKNHRTKIDSLSAAALRLILFSGARHREILHAKRAELDRQRGFLNLARSKTGKKTIVLNALALAVIDTIPDTGPYLFPGTEKPQCSKKDKWEPKPRTSLKRAWTAIRKRAGLEDVRIHDLRHTFASVGVAENLGLPVVGKLLGHANLVSTARYAHLEADPARRASNAIGQSIANALNSGVAA